MMGVTTRFRVRWPWQLLAMYRAYRRMRRDLRAAPGLLRYAFFIQSPFACCTFSVWVSQEALDRFANVPSHVAGVRGAKGFCREIWSAYWRLDAVSTYASQWTGHAAWPSLVPHPEQPWRLVEPGAVADIETEQGTERDDTLVAAAPAEKAMPSWDWPAARGDAPGAEART